MRAFTLVELLIAMSLVGMIILAVVSLQVSAQKFLTTADWESRVQNEVSPVLERIVKDISAGRGNLTCPTVSITGSNKIRIQHDSCKPALWTEYTFENNTIKYSETGFNQVLAKNIFDCQFRLDTSYSEASFKFTSVAITITARRDAVDLTVIPNPTVVLETSVAVR